MENLDETRSLTCLIGGQAKGSGPEQPVVNPANPDEVVAVCRTATSEEVSEAIDAARNAVVPCRAMGLQARAEALQKVATELGERSAELARLLVREEGKTFLEALGEVKRSAQIFSFYAGESVRLQGEWGHSIRPGITVEVQREPVGVVGIITPWNFPIAIPAWKIAPALAYGNAVVMKPAALAPCSAYVLGDIISRAGFPVGAFNLVLGSGSKVGQAIAESLSVDAVSFTGSQGVGAGIAATCSARMARYQLEMGGKNPLVVLNDADLDIAVHAAVNGAFYSTGQRCTASSRLIIEEGIHDEFLDAMCVSLASKIVGNPLDPGTHIGPVIDENQLRNNLDYVALGTQEGCTVLFGEEDRASDLPGYFQTPALLSGAENTMRVCQEEIFGPVATVIKVANYDEGLEIANATPFGLSAGIVTRSHKHANHFKQRSKSGLVMVNLPTAGLDYHVPFGGVAGSSFGAREQGTHAKEFYTITKTVYDLAA